MTPAKGSPESAERIPAPQLGEVGEVGRRAPAAAAVPARGLVVLLLGPARRPAPAVTEQQEQQVLLLPDQRLAVLLSQQQAVPQLLPDKDVKEALV